MIVFLAVLFLLVVHALVCRFELAATRSAFHVALAQRDAVSRQLEGAEQAVGTIGRIAQLALDGDHDDAVALLEEWSVDS